MAPHSSTLAWKIPWMEEPGGLQSMGSLRVGQDSATWLSLFTFMHWRRKGQPTPVFLPGESQGQGSLVGCCLWGRMKRLSSSSSSSRPQQNSNNIGQKRRGLKRGSQKTEVQKTLKFTVLFREARAAWGGKVAWSLSQRCRFPGSPV